MRNILSYTLPVFFVFKAVTCFCILIGFSLTVFILLSNAPLTLQNHDTITQVDLVEQGTYSAAHREDLAEGG